MVAFGFRLGEKLGGVHGILWRPRGLVYPSALMSGPVLGIDLGTTNSVVSVADATQVRVLAGPDGQSLIPSVVSFHPRGDILVGQVAKERRLLDAKNTIYSVKRLIGRPFTSPEVQKARERFAFEIQQGPTGGALVVARDESYSLPEISAFVLREVRTIAERALRTECRRAVITVPANFNELQRNATKAAGRVAGLDVLRILNEPTAAALAYGLQSQARERVAIFDLGGGTFDITILELNGEVYEVMATAGDTYLGGDDVDVLVADQMADAFLQHHNFDPRQDRQAFERLRAAAEWAKCQLSHEPEVHLRVEELAYGDGGLSLDLSFGLSRESLDAMTQPLLARAFGVCDDAMRIAGISATQLDKVILVGGSTRMPLVRAMVRDYFGREPLSDIDPDLVVSKGAALQGLALVPAAERRALAKVQLRRTTVDGAPPKRRRAATREEVHPDAVHRDHSLAAPPSSPTQAPAVPPIPAPLPGPSHQGREPTQGFETRGGGREPTQGFEIQRPQGVPVPVGKTAARDAADSDVPSRNRPPSGMPPTPQRAPSRLPPAPPKPALPLDLSEDTVLELRDSDFPVHSAPGAASIRKIADDSLPRGGEERPSRPASSRPAPLQGFAEDDEPLPTAPLLLDVTPHSLNIETVGGFCEPIIRRNASIPVEQARIFSTGHDNQASVALRICQGEARRIEENQNLGAIELSGLRPGPRGSVKIEVTFVIDPDGTLSVRAEDTATGQSQMTKIRLVGGFDEDEVDRMRARQDALLSTGGKAG